MNYLLGTVLFLMILLGLSSCAHTSKINVPSDCDAYPDGPRKVTLVCKHNLDIRVSK